MRRPHLLGREKSRARERPNGLLRAFRTICVEVRSAVGRAGVHAPVGGAATQDKSRVRRGQFHADEDAVLITPDCYQRVLLAGQVAGDLQRVAGSDGDLHVHEPQAGDGQRA